MRAAGAFDHVFPRRGWRNVRIGPIKLQVPPDWGEIEPDVQDGYVIHNRPRRYRVDGDALWYATAIEIRIGKHPPPAAGPLSAMAETTRTIAGPDGRIVLTLAIANGVGAKQRRDALWVLRNAKRAPGDQRMIWGAAPAQHTRESDAPAFHARISGPVRR